MVRYKILVFIILAAFIISCAPSKKIVTDLSFETALRRINFRDQYVKAITAKGNVTIDAPDFSNSAKLQAILKRPDTLKLKLETIFGIGLGEVEVYGDSFKVVDRFNDRVLSGKVDEYLRRYLGLNLGFKEVVNVLIATPKVENTRIYNSEDYVFSIHERRGSDEIILSFNPELELESYTFFKAGVKVFEVRYSKYVKVGETTLPRVIKIYDGEGRGIYFNFSKIEING